MAIQKTQGYEQTQSTQKSADGKISVAGSRNRKIYSYALSPNDRVALQQVQLCENVCRAVKVAIKNGTKISPAVITACTTVATLGNEMLFQE